MHCTLSIIYGGIQSDGKGDQNLADIQDEQRSQIMKWLNALETVGSFAATSLPGAMIQLAWAMCDIETVINNIEANEREGKSKYKVLEYANGIERQLKSIADVLVC